MTEKNKFQKIGSIRTVKGSILNPESSELCFVLNVADTGGKNESPLYPTFNKKWNKVKPEIRGWYVQKTGAYKLGAIHTLPVQSSVWVISMLCQDDKMAVDLKAVETSLKEICKSAKYEKATLHISNMLVDLIPQLPQLVKELVVEQGVNVSYYQN